MDSEGWKFMIEAYRLFGLDDIADLLKDAKRAFRTEADSGAVESRANDRYSELVGDNQLFDAFRTYLRAHPEKFAPVTVAESQRPL